MINEEMEKLFEELRGKWDTEEPAHGHRERFAQRLALLGDAGSTPTDGTAPAPGGGLNGSETFRLRHLYIQWAAAASIAILISIGVFAPKQARIESKMSEIAPEAQQSAYYFSGLIEEQIRELESLQTPQTAPLIRSTLAEIDKLEQDYSVLEAELVRGGNTPLLVRAMITNYQTRINLLNDVLLQIEQFQLLNTQDNENLDL